MKIILSKMVKNGIKTKPLTLLCIIIRSCFNHLWLDVYSQMYSCAAYCVGSFMNPKNSEKLFKTNEINEDAFPLLIDTPYQYLEGDIGGNTVNC
jgi:hypothetical protein